MATAFAMPYLITPKSPSVVTTFIPLLFTYWAFGQSASLDLVTAKELTMTSYEKDSTSDAVCLFDVGEVIWDISRGTILNIHYRIKILRKTDYSKYADVVLLGERDEINNLHASTYNLVNGAIMRSDVKEDEIYKQRQKSYEKLSFALPNVAQGSVIDVSYTQTWPDFELINWNFQRSIPVIWSEFKFNSGLFNYLIDYRGNPKFAIQESSKKEQVKRWVMTDVPTFRPEPMMLDETVFKMSIKFWPVDRSGWEGIASDLATNLSFGYILRGDDQVKQRTDAITQGVTDSMKKIENITMYLKKQVAWDGREDFMADNPVDIFKMKEGSSGDINLLLGAMLKTAGFDVTMVLIRTRGKGLPIEQLIYLHQFNYVICRVKNGENSILLDATEPLLPFDQLPDRCLNHSGLLLDSKPVWIPIAPNVKYKVSLNVDLAIDEQGTLAGNCRLKEDGYAALEVRKELSNKGEPHRYFASKGWDIKNYQVHNTDSLNKPVQEIFDMIIGDQANVVGDKIFFNPFLGLEVGYPALTSPVRIYPLDLGLPQETTFICNITLPPGYELESVPEGKIVRLQDNSAKCTFHFGLVGNRLTTMLNMQVNKTVFAPEEYAALWDFFSRITSKMAEQQVLRKKG